MTLPLRIELAMTLKVVFLNVAARGTSHAGLPSGPGEAVWGGIRLIWTGICPNHVYCQLLRYRNGRGAGYAPPAATACIQADRPVAKRERPLADVLIRGWFIPDGDDDGGTGPVTRLSGPGCG